MTDGRTRSALGLRKKAEPQIAIMPRTAESGANLDAAPARHYSIA